MNGVKSGNLYHLFESRFPADPKARFITLMDGPRQGVWYTYADVASISARFAHAMLALGVKQIGRASCRERV